MTRAKKACNDVKASGGSGGGVRGTYALLRKLKSINGSDIGEPLVNRAMYNFEALPPWGKEYWWFLFFGRDGKQMMIVLFRKFGRTMVFNGKEIVLKQIDPRVVQAVTAGWIFDGKKLHDLGVANPIITARPSAHELTSQLSDKTMILHGGYPAYELTVDDLIHVKMTEGTFLANKFARGVYLPPFGAGWVDVYSNAEGTVLGKRFAGTAHLQKVVGVMPYGPFHWSRIVFQNNSTFSFFCLKTGRESTRYFQKDMTFCDHETKKRIQFKKLNLRITKKRGQRLEWIVEGQDHDHALRTVLEAYAEKTFTMTGGGSQVYVEYAVKPTEFSFRTKDLSITLKDLGEGVGTFEDAYGSPLF
jgi:hypothetical protein